MQSLPAMVKATFLSDGCWNWSHCIQNHFLGNPPPQFFSAYAGAFSNLYILPSHSIHPEADPKAISTCKFACSVLLSRTSTVECMYLSKITYYSRFWQCTVGHQKQCSIDGVLLQEFSKFDGERNSKVHSSVKHHWDDILKDVLQWANALRRRRQCHECCYSGELSNLLKWTNPRWLGHLWQKLNDEQDCLDASQSSHFIQDIHGDS